MKNIKAEVSIQTVKPQGYQKELLNRIQQIANMGGWEIDLNDMSISWTDQVAGIHELPFGEVLKVKKAINFYAPEARPIIKKAFDDGVKKGIPWDLELQFITAKGNHKWVRSIGFPEQEDDKTIRLTGIFQDVTESKLNKTQLLKTNRDLNLFIECTGAGTWDWLDVNGDKEWWSPRFYELLGYENNEIEASLKKFSELLHPDDLESTFEKVDKHFKKREPFITEYRLKGKSGEYKWFKGTGQATWDEKGTPIKMVGSIIDIHTRKVAELQLKESQVFFERITGIIPSVIYVFNQETMSNEYVNKEIGSSLGYNQEEIKKFGSDLLAILSHPDDLPKIGNHFEKIKKLKGSEVANVEYRMKHKNGTYKWLLSIDTVFERDKKNKVRKHLGIASDITELKKNEELIKNQIEQLKNKNKELEQFVYVASHDLQEPLRTMSSYVKLIVDLYSGKLDEDATRFLTHIDNASLRMKNLIKDLLDYSRLGRKKIFTKVNCNELVKLVISDLELTISDNEVSVNTSKLPIITGLEIELKQLFQNIISNAIKFRKKNELSTIKLSVEENNDNWIFCIQDNGIGIAKEHLERIFIIFQRLHTRDEFEGTGIGLSLCKKIVELHGGEIWVESALNEGSKFYFTIPKNITTHEKEI